VARGKGRPPSKRKASIVDKVIKKKIVGKKLKVAKKEQFVKVQKR
jgi:hypothetical protein